MTRRVGVVGYAHEVNGFAAPITLGHGIDVARRPGGLAGSWEAGPLVRALGGAPTGHDHGTEVVELPVWEFGASGPLRGDDFRTLLADVLDGLRDATGARPLDGLVVLGHGAGRTTDDLDPDATFLHALRAAVGPDAPIVVVLDFHANVSTEMVTAVDAVVGYRTNPHVDIADRLVEAASHVHRLLDGAATAVVHRRMPMVLPQIAQLTAPDQPLGEVMAQAIERIVPPVRNVSVFGGFSLADVPCSGVSVCVTIDRDERDLGERVVDDLCRELWDRRSRYRLHAVPLDDAVGIALDACAGRRPPVLMADVADNPGGGAPATSPYVLRELLAAGAAACGDVVMGLQCDRAVVERAWALGVGATATFVLNEGSTHPLAPQLTLEADVVALTDGPLVPTRGVYANSTRHPGRCCALRVGRLLLGVSSHPVQCADDDTLRHAGLDPAGAHVVVVKSRGHFRAGFAHLFTDDRIVEVGAPGVATPELHTLPWEHLPRPVFPLDEFDLDSVTFEPVTFEPVTLDPEVAR